MAEDPKTPEQIKAETEAANEQSAAFSALQKKTLDLADAKNFLNSAMGKVTTAVMGATGGLLKFGESAEGVTGILGKFALSAAAVGTNIGRTLANPVSDTGEAMKKLLPNVSAINDGIKQLITTQNAARQAIVLMGGSLDQADIAASKYPQTLRNMSSALGISTKDLHSMTAAIGIVPGAIGEASGKMMGIGTLIGTTVQPAAVLATTMKAFGMNAQDAAALGRRGFLEFGQTIPDTLKQVGRMADASKQAGVDLGTTREQIEAASKGLAIFGTGSATAASTWTTFMTSLKGSGVPIAEIGNMVTALTGSFANMSLQTRAAISSMSGMGGGRTALGGALQMEVNMRTPGGMEKNMEAMTATLAKFGGGRIITLQEAAANPQLEAQFVVQRQMLGKLTGISNTEQQNRILETMQNVQRGGMSQVEGGKALESAFEKGKDVQTQQLTFLEKIEQHTQAMIGGTAYKQVEAFNKVLTTGGLTGKQREAGGTAGAAAMGRAMIERPSEDEYGRRISRLAMPSMPAASYQMGAASRRAFGAAERAGRPSRAVGPTESGPVSATELLRQFTRGATGAKAGIELPPEAKLARRPAYAAIPPAGGRTARRSPYENLTATAAARPAESPLFRVADVLQKSDSTKVKLMEQMLAALQQKVAAEEMPLPTGEFVPKRPATLPAPEEAGGGGGGSVITVKIIGDEEKVKKMVEEALSRKSLHAIGHTQ